MEGAGGAQLPIAGHERLCLQVDERAEDVWGPERELALERVTHVPNLGLHNLLLVKRYAQSSDAPI